MKSIELRVHKKDLFFFLFLISITITYFLPSLLNYKYIAAVAVGDDGLFAYSSVLKYPERFADDIIGYVWKANVVASLVNYGSIFFAHVCRIPLGLVYNTLIFFQLFALPIAMMFFLKRKVRFNYTECIFALLFILLSGYYAWNFANYKEVPTPYAGVIIHVFMWLGLYGVAHNKRSGFALLALCSLIHVSYTLYAVLAAFLIIISDRESFKISKLIMLAGVFVLAVLPPLLILQADFPKVSLEDIRNVTRFNMHATPWASPFLNWYEGLPNCFAFMLLSLVSIPYWKKFGDAYKRLIICTFIAVIILCISQFIGHMIQYPRLIKIMGLRSPILLAVVLLPVLVLFFRDHIAHSHFFMRFMAALVVFSVAVYTPYGIDKAPIIFMALFMLSEKRSPLLNKIICLLGIAWAVFWIFYVNPKPQPLSKENMEVTWAYIPHLKATLWTDYKPFMRLAQKLPCFIAAFMVAATPWVVKSIFSNHPIIKKTRPIHICVAFLVIAFGFVCYKRQEGYSNPQNQDLYEAQVWAKNNTHPDSRFLVPVGSWRSFSERKAFHIVPQRRYFYYPDARIKRFDDTIMTLFNLHDQFKKINLKQWYLVTQYVFPNKFKQPRDFLRLSYLTKSRYLVEERRLNLPLVYSNDTYYIYDLNKIAENIRNAKNSTT